MARERDPTSYLVQCLNHVVDQISRACALLQ